MKGKRFLKKDDISGADVIRAEKNSIQEVSGYEGVKVKKKLPMETTVICQIYSNIKLRVHFTNLHVHTFTPTQERNGEGGDASWGYSTIA